jgi:hemerythrin-like domain-containing protein
MNKNIYASEDLIKEHEGIRSGLTILERMVTMLREKEQIDMSDFREMVEFFKLFADKCHHGKEETMLFPEMEKAGIPKENGPIGQMLIEHGEGRKYISRMSEIMNEGIFNTGGFIQAAENYIDLLRHHIDKENTVLFPLGDKKIPAEIQKRLLESFETFEEDVMGPGTHEKLHGLLKSFKNKYLN